MAARCACESGFAWQKQGDHPCGCREAQPSGTESAIPTHSLGPDSGVCDNEPALASSSPANCCGGCCCEVANFCVFAGLGDDIASGLEAFLISKKRHTIATIHYSTHWETDAGTGGAFPRCKQDYLEAAEPLHSGLRDTGFAGYPGWKWDKFNDFSRHGGLPQHNADWFDKQKCNLTNQRQDYSDYPGYRIGLLHANRIRQLIFSRVSTEAHATKCLDGLTCCALLKIDWQTSAIMVSGPVCGDVCKEDPTAKTKAAPWGQPDKVVDVDQTFAAWSSHVASAIGVLGRLNVVPPWRLANREATGLNEVVRALNSLPPSIGVLVGDGEQGRCAL